MRSLRNGDTRRFGYWWLATIALGAYFLIGTGREWHHLIDEKGLTIQTNLFGTTFYSLVGLHASHVVVGLVALAIVMAFASRGAVKPEHSERVARAVALLAFRGRGLGRRVYGGLHHRTLNRRRNSNESTKK